MDKVYETKLRRTFLLEGLPEPLTAADRHLQLFDNYIEGTRLRIRTLRIPETGEWRWFLEQRFPISEELSAWKHVQVALSEAEHGKLEQFEGREIRKNRYFHTENGRDIEIDVYLGALWGLNIATVEFAEEAEMAAFHVPAFAAIEVTSNGFFYGESLVGKKFTDVRTAVEAIVSSRDSALGAAEVADCEE